jgi:hypothetical protein
MTQTVPLGQVWSQKLGICRKYKPKNGRWWRGSLDLRGPPAVGALLYTLKSNNTVEALAIF